MIAHRTPLSPRTITQQCHFEWSWVTKRDLAKYSLTWSVSLRQLSSLFSLYHRNAAYILGHFTFRISPSLSGIAERNRFNWQASRSNYREYLYVLKYFIIIIIIDNRIYNFIDCILIGIFHWESVLNFSGRKNGGHFERRDAINTFVFGEILPACAKEYLTAATYYCQVEVEVRDRTAAVDAIFLPVSCSDIISKQ